MKRIIVKVRKNKKTGQKTATVPKEAKRIKGGDYIEITKIKK